MSRVLPILFNTEMVRAILDGRKTVTRRLIKPKSKNAYGFYVTFRKLDNAFMGVYDYDEDEIMFESSQAWPCVPGDILYVRETWMLEGFYEDEALIRFRADGGKKLSYEKDGEFYQKLYKFADDKWNPSLFMPKEAARIWLKVTDVRVERLQDITVWEAKKEGTGEDCIGISACGGGCETCPAHADNYVLLFEKIWNSTLKKSDLDRYGWNANPWVWVIEFERCGKPESEG